VVDIPLRHYDDIVTNVVVVMVLFDHLLADCLHVGDVTENGQADLLLAEDTPVRNLYSCFQGLAFSCLQEFSVDGASLVFDILPSVQRIGEHVAHDLNCSFNILAENCHHVRCVLPRCVGIQVSANILHLQLQVISGANFGPLEMQMLQEVSDTAGLLALVSTAAFNED
jgi:hypothetical protein